MSAGGTEGRRRPAADLRRALLGLSLVVALCGCSQIVRYTDELTNGRSGRSVLVTAPATVGGFAGFVVGIPAAVIALPVTFVVYRVQKEQNKLKADPVSTMLFPSFALWRAGTLLAVPMDIIEFLAVRVWRPPLTPTREEQEEFEYDLDSETLDAYPVEPIYPADDPPPAGAPGRSSAG